MPEIGSVTVGNVSVRVNPGNQQRVQSIQYVQSSAATRLANLSDVEFGVPAPTDGSAIITYNSNTQMFIVQSALRINGGTF